VTLQILALFRYNERYEFYLDSGKTPIENGGELNKCVVFSRRETLTDEDKNFDGVLWVLRRSQLYFYTIQFPIHDCQR